MIKNRLNKSTLQKKNLFFDILFYILFAVSIMCATILDKSQLIYIMPIVILTIVVNYINTTRKKAKPVFIIALIIILFSEFISLYDFKKYFSSISVLTSLYLLCFIILLKPYTKGKLKSLLSTSVILGTLLVSYIIFALIKLLINEIPSNMVFYVFLTSFFLLIYSVVFAIIYINDNYNNVIILLAAGICSIVSICLTSINEFILFKKVFTVLIIICHILSICLFMRFIVINDSKTSFNSKEDYI